VTVLTTNEASRRLDGSRNGDAASFDFLGEPRKRPTIPHPEDNSGESCSIWTRSTTHPASIRQTGTLKWITGVSLFPGKERET